MAKSSSREPSNQKKSKKKKNKAGPDVVAMKVKVPKDNPFETIWSRRKFDILGKKRKGEERRIGLARSRAIEKRNKTLLKEYEQSGKSSVFVDKRIGEQNEELDEFGKAVLRSQRESQLSSKLNKKSKYNLSDEEEEDFEGLGFQGRDDFEDEMFPDDDDDDAEAGETEKNSSVVHYLNNNLKIQGEEGEENKHKSKKEVMDEIILKSKFFKAQKAKDKEANEHLLEDLDRNFTSLVQSEALLSLTEPSKMNSLKALVNKSVPNESRNKDSLCGTRTIDSSVQEKPDAYDKLVKEMALEMRARPSDRIKTPDEIAQEEREHLERLEEERQKRMTAAEDSSGEDDEDSEKPPKDRPKFLSGDDLGDSFSVSEETMTKKGWIDEILEREDAEDYANEDDEASGDSEGSEDADEGSDEELDEHDKDLSLKDWEQSDDDNINLDLKEEESDDDEEKEKVVEEHDRVSSEKKELDAVVDINGKRNDSVGSLNRDRDSLHARKIDVVGKQSSSKSDIPYIIEAPKNFEELCLLLDNCSNSNVIMVISRIRASNAIKLAAENLNKMRVFYGLLLQYFAVLASKKPLNLELLNLLVKPLMEMSLEIPFFSAICARQRIEKTRLQFVQSIKNPESSSWPSSKTLFLLQLWSKIFPCSDFRHPVMTPAILLMCEYLMRCPILSGRDIAIGSFLCCMLLSIFKQSRKFCPEVIIFLRTVLMAATEDKSMSCEDSQFDLMELKALKPLLCIRGRVDEIRPLNFFKIIDMPDDSAYFSSDDFRASALVVVIETLQGYIKIYEGLSSFPETFSPLLKSLLEIEEQKNMPNALCDKIKDVSELIKSKVDELHTLRRPLQMRKQKPVPKKLLNPKFEENFVKGRDYDPDRERAEMKKLKKLVKHEAKRASRELRKDTAFLFNVKEQQKALLEQEKTEKYGRARAFLQEQEHAFKSGQLGKGRKRRR